MMEKTADWKKNYERKKKRGIPKVLTDMEKKVKVCYCYYIKQRFDKVL